jgi:hypothetical protein
MSTRRSILEQCIVIGALTLSLSSCAPAMQDARLLPPGTVAITPAISGSGVSDNGSEYLGQMFGATVEVGVHERVNVGGAIGRFDISDTTVGINGAAFGARIGIVRDRVAVSLPLSFNFGERIDTADTWAFHPTALFTVPAGQHVDLNPFFRVVIPMCPGCDASDVLLGFGSGVGIALHPKVTLRPEVGLLVNPGESGIVWTFGAGVSLRAR